MLHVLKISAITASYIWIQDLRFSSTWLYKILKAIFIMYILYTSQQRGITWLQFTFYKFCCKEYHWHELCKYIGAQQYLGYTRGLCSWTVQKTIYSWIRNKQFLISGKQVSDKWRKMVTHLKPVGVDTIRIVRVQQDTIIVRVHQDSNTTFWITFKWMFDSADTFGTNCSIL